MSYKFVTGALVGDMSLITEDTIEALGSISGSGAGRFLTLDISGGALTVDAAGAVVAAGAISSSAAVSADSLDIDDTITAGGVISGSSFLAGTTITSTGIISSSAALKGASLDVNNGVMTVSSAGALYALGNVSSSAAVKGASLDVNNGQMTVSSAGAVVAVGDISSSAAVKGATLDVNNGVMTVSSAGAISGSSTLEIAGATTLGSTLSVSGTATLATNLNVIQSSSDSIMSSSNHDGDIIFHGNSAQEIGRFDGSAGTLLMNTSKKIRFADGGEYVVSDGTDLTVASGADIILAPSSGVVVAVGDISSSAAVKGATLDINNGKATIASTGNTLLAGTVQFSGITADTALVVANDGLFFNDGRDGTVKNVNVGSFCTDIAGAGLSVTNNQLVATSNAVTLGVTASATSTEVLSVGYNYFTGAEGCSATLPTGSASSVGDTITVKDTGPLAAGQGITISRSGSGGSAVDRIDGQTSVVLQSPYGSITFIYLAEKVWGIV